MSNVTEASSEELATPDIISTFLEDTTDSGSSSASSSNISLASKATVIEVSQFSRNNTNTSNSSNHTANRILRFPKLVLADIPKFKPQLEPKPKTVIDYGMKVNPIPQVFVYGHHQKVVLEGKTFRGLDETTRKMAGDSPAAQAQHAASEVQPESDPLKPNSAKSSIYYDVENKASGAYSVQRFGLVWKIPATTCNELLSRMQDSSTQSSAYVYSFGFDQSLESSLPVSFEFYRNRASEFVNIRVSSETGFSSGSMAMLSFSDPSSSLTVSILDDDGLIVRGEKWAPALEFADRGVKFEVEDFISRTEISNLLITYGAMNLLMSFSGCEMEFPEYESPEETKEHEHAAGHGDSSNTDHHPLPVFDIGNDEFENNFQSYIAQKGFNALLGAQIQNENFVDAIIQVKYENEVIGIPVHRVFLAAQSVLLASLLDGSSELTIEGFEFPCINVMLEFAYGGEVLTQDMELLTKLLKLAEMFHINGLREKCIQNIHRNYVFGNQHGHETFTEYFKIGEQLQSPIFIKMAAIEFERSRMENDEDERFEEPSDYGDSETAQIQEKLEQLSLFLSSESETRLKPEAADDVALLGTFTETWVGLLYTVPPDLCDMLWNNVLPDEQPSTEEESNECCICCEYALDLNLTTSDATDGPTGLLQIFKDKKSSKEVNLKVVAYDSEDELSMSDNEEIENESDSRTDGERIHGTSLEDNIGLTLNASLYDNSGRIVHECHSRSYVKYGCERVWEIKPFFSITDFQMSELADESGILMFRVSIGCVKGYPVASIVNPRTNESEYEKLKKYNTEFFDKIMLNPFNHRLLPQLGNPTFSDAVLHVVGRNEENNRSIPIHRIIVAAFCPLFGVELQESKEIYLSDEDYSVHCIEAALKYMYSGFIPKMTVDLGLELLCAAKELGVHGLRDYTLDRILRLPLTFESAVVIYKFGLLNDSSAVQNAARKYFKKNRKTIVNLIEYLAFIQEHPEVAEYLKQFK